MFSLLHYEVGITLTICLVQLAEKHIIWNNENEWLRFPNAFVLLEAVVGDSGSSIYELYYDTGLVLPQRYDTGSF